MRASTIRSVKKNIPGSRPPPPVSAKQSHQRAQRLCPSKSVRGWQEGRCVDNAAGPGIARGSPAAGTTYVRLRGCRGQQGFPPQICLAQPLRPVLCSSVLTGWQDWRSPGSPPQITTRRKCQRYRSRCVVMAPHLVPCRQIHACASEECKGARWHHAGFSLKIKSHPCFPGRATSSFLSNNHEDASLMQFSVGGQCVESARNRGPPEVELPGFIVGFPMARGRHFFQ